MCIRDSYSLWRTKPVQTAKQWCDVITSTGLVDNRAFNGDRLRNPFNFAHCNLSEIGLYLDGQQQHAVRPIQPNFTDGQYIRAYNSVFSGTGKLNADKGLYIDRSDYYRGYALYAFDLTADLGEDDHFSLVRDCLLYTSPSPRD